MSPNYAVDSLRQQVEIRANGLCEYCQSPKKYCTASFHCDHIHPKKEDGKTELTNLAFACPSCNIHKAAKMYAPDPSTGESAPIFNPRQQNWHRHFQWSNDFLYIEGKTSIGRATVKALNMNKDEQIALRKLLKNAGKHPPT